jgi:hypothetical protein
MVASWPISKSNSLTKRSVVSQFLTITQNSRLVSVGAYKNIGDAIDSFEAATSYGLYSTQQAAAQEAKALRVGNK